jgi:hypothetical protein
MKSPKQEIDKALDSIFKGFSFYSEPVEEREVQRQINEYKKMKVQFKKMNKLQFKDHLKQSIKINEGNEYYGEKQMKNFLQVPPTVEDKQKDKTNQVLLNNLKQATSQIKALPPSGPK